MGRGEDGGNGEDEAALVAAAANLSSSQDGSILLRGESSMSTQKYLRDRVICQKRKAAVKSTEDALWKGEAKRMKEDLMEEMQEDM